MSNRQTARKAQAETRVASKKFRAQKITIADGDVPDGALAWTPENMENWRRGLMAEFGVSPEALIALEILPHCAKRGYSERDNCYLISQTGLWRSQVYSAIKTLTERGYFAVRYCGDRRRMWPASPLRADSESTDNGHAESIHDGFMSPSRMDSESTDNGLTSPSTMDSHIIIENLRDSREQKESPKPSASMRQVAPPVDSADGRTATIALSEQERASVADVYGLSPTEIDLLDKTSLDMDIADAIKRFGGQGSEAFKAWRAYADRRHHAPPWWSADEFGPRAVEDAFWESPFWKSWKADQGRVAKAAGYRLSKHDGAYELSRHKRTSA